MLVLVPLDLGEPDARELAVFDCELLRRVVTDDFYSFLDGVFELPVGSLEHILRLARDYLDLLATDPQRCAAAVHGGIAATDNDDALAD